MKIVVFGAGGVGGYFGSRWSEAGLDVTLVARGDHLEAAQRSGMKIVSPLGDSLVPVPVTDDPSAIGEVDVVIVATKTWQLSQAVRVIKPLVGEETMVVGLQNGVETAGQITEALGADRALGGSCRIISYIEQPGVIRHVGADPTIILGELGGGNSDRARRVVDTLNPAPGLEVHLSDQIESVIWHKFHFFAPVAGVSSVTHAAIGTMRSTPQVRSMLRAAMDEVVAVAQANGITMDDNTTDRSLAFVDKLPENGTSSMQRDFAAGRRTELESLNGAVVRMGQQLNVAVPVNALLYAALLPRELHARTR